MFSPERNHITRSRSERARRRHARSWSTSSAGVAAPAFAPQVVPSTGDGSGAGARVGGRSRLEYGDAPSEGPEATVDSDRAENRRLGVRDRDARLEPVDRQRRGRRVRRVGERRQGRNDDVDGVHGDRADLRPGLHPRRGCIRRCGQPVEAGVDRGERVRRHATTDRAHEPHGLERDLELPRPVVVAIYRQRGRRRLRHLRQRDEGRNDHWDGVLALEPRLREIGRASCRERV